MRPAPRFVISGLLCGVCAGALVGAQGPIFRGSINLLRLDVTVVTDDGTPVADLTPEDFVVTVDGHPRPVRSAEFIDLRSSGGEQTEIRDPARSFSTNSPQGTGRVTVLAVDESSLYEGQEMALLDYLGRFLDEMGPADRTGLLVLPHPGGKGRHVEMTNDVSEIREALSRVHGLWRGERSLSPSDNIATNTFAQAADPFKTDLEAQVMSIVRNELTNLAEVLAHVDGPKTLILVARDVPSGVGSLSDGQVFAEKAARARLKLYVVRQIPVPGVAADGVPLDAKGTGQGVFELAGMTGGVVFDAVGRGKGAFDRIARETSGEYLIGVEPDQSAPFSKPLKVDVHVKRPRLTVRSPKQILPPLTRKTADLKETLGTLMMQPRLSTEIPMRIAAFTAKAGEKNKLKAVLVVEMENAASPIAWGFQARQDNRLRADAFEAAANGEAVAENVTSLSTSAVLAPGEYRLIFGAIGADGRRGTVQHPLDVTLHKAGDVEFSDVFVGEAVKGHFRPRIVFGPGHRSLVAFVELYPSPTTTIAQLQARFDLACESAPGSGVTPFVAGGAGPLSPAAGKLRADIGLDVPPGVHGECTVTASIQNGGARGRAERGIAIAAEAGPAMLP